MTTHKYIDQICVAILLFTVVITVLFMNGRSFGIEAIVDEDAESYEGNTYFTAKDQNGSWDTSEATVISLNGDHVTINGTGAYEYNGGVYIASGGSYILSGTLTNGSIVVDTYVSSKVWLMLDGADITCENDACIRVNEADKVFLTLAEGSENTLTGGVTYSAEALSDGAEGVIYAHDDLTINGSGSLTINAQYMHGIEANDDLVITGGSIRIDAVEDGITVNESFRMKDADLTISAGDDGIRSDSDIYIESGTLLISECYEGLEAGCIEVHGGDITIYPTDDGFNANAITSSMGGPGGQTSTSDEDDTPCYILITGGNITIINMNGNDADGLDSNKDITITGGTVTISVPGQGANNAIDFGSESGGKAVISGGTVIATGGAAMAEGFDNSSLQASFMYTYAEAIEAGTAITLENASGDTLLSYETPCSVTALTLSCPDMAVGGTYRLTVGTDTEEITLTDTSVTLGDGATGFQGGPHGAGGRGAFQGGGAEGFRNDDRTE